MIHTYMEGTAPQIRRDLEFLPVQHGDQQLIFIRDHLGLVQEGKAVALPLYQFMTLLDGTRTMRDLQVELMRESGGTLVGMEEIKGLLAHLEDSCLLDTELFRNARDKIMADFAAKRVRPCSHCGQAYPADPSELKNRLDEILASQAVEHEPEGKIRALISPHIDLSVGHKTYSSAYQVLKGVTPARVVVLGVGHTMVNELFSLTDKDFETPLGVIESERSLIQKLKEAGGDIIGPNDFAHRSEHSIEFQLIFLKHLLDGISFTIIPVLCGSIQPCLPEYSREAYLEKTAPFLEAMRQILQDPEEETLLVAGVDFSHVGPKFGHEMPAQYLKDQSECHDMRLLQYLSARDPDLLWEESKRVEDQFNVCGIPAMACLLETLPPAKGEILHYERWNEEPTQSAVSYAAMVYTSSS
jgi:AmmeMemoRadiSam system protein B